MPPSLPQTSFSTCVLGYAIRTSISAVVLVPPSSHFPVPSSATAATYRGADKSLARLGMKQATVTKL